MAMNGGMYMEDQNALGLLIQNGRQVRPLNKHKDEYGNFYMQPNGVFGLGADNQAFVVATEDYEKQKNVKWATQSGPMLVHKGKINSSFKAGSANLNIRNGAGVISPTRVMFAISNERVNFYEFAELFKSFGCTQALYLDGAISQMYLPEAGRTGQQGDGLGPIIAVFN